MESHTQKPSGRLVEPREDTYFAIAMVFSIMGWLACLVTISPICIVSFMVFFAWLANGLLVAQLKADAVKVEALVAELADGRKVGRAAVALVMVQEHHILVFFGAETAGLAGMIIPFENFASQLWR